MRELGAGGGGSGGSKRAHGFACDNSRAVGLILDIFIDFYVIVDFWGIWRGHLLICRFFQFFFIFFEKIIDKRRGWWYSILAGGR